MCVVGILAFLLTELSSGKRPPWQKLPSEVGRLLNFCVHILAIGWLIMSDACVCRQLGLFYRLSTERDEVISGVIEDFFLSLEIQYSIGAGQLSSTSYQEYLLKILVWHIIIILMIV